MPKKRSQITSFYLSSDTIMKNLCYINWQSWLHLWKSAHLANIFNFFSCLKPLSRTNVTYYLSCSSVFVFKRRLIDGCEFKDIWLITCMTYLSPDESFSKRILQKKLFYFQLIKVRSCLICFIERDKCIYIKLTPN